MSAARDELWALACRLNARHQSQLRLLAQQARRGAQPTRRGGQGARRWWYYELDYAHPLEIPARP